MSTHIEHPEDHTEHEALPFPVGYVDPYEQTGSDDEVAPVPTKPYVRVKYRYDRWRIWKETNTFTGRPFWIAQQPETLAVPMFKVGVNEDGEDLFSSGFKSHDHELVKSNLQVALLKAQAQQHMYEAIQEFKP